MDYFYSLKNKIMLFDQSSESRAERNRKNLLYKQMLDEQIRYKNSHLQTQKLNYYSTPQHRNKNQPIFREPSSNQNLLMRTQPEERPYFRNNRQINDPQLRVERHLNTCEEILKNLRELREKQRKKEPQPTQTSPKQANHPELKSNKLGNMNQRIVHNFPKNSHFSSVFARLSEGKVNFKQEKHYKTIEQAEKSPKKHHTQQHQKNNLKITPNIKIKSQRKSHNVVESSRSNELESVHPTGLKKKSSSRRISNNGTQKSNKQKEGTKKQEQSKIKSPQRDRDRDRELDQLKQELSECLIEITKYVQSKKQSEEEEKRKKSERVDEEIQAGPTESEIEKLKQAKMHELKLKALIKLRKIKEQSRDLVNKVEGDDPARDSILKKNKKEKSKSRLSEQFELELSKQKIKLQEHPPHISQTNLNRIAKTPSPLFVDTKPQQLSSTNHSQNQELILTMMKHLNRQEQQNEELVHCMKQLSQYLNHQNQEIESLKNSRQKSISPIAKKSKERKLKQSRIKSSIEKDEEVRRQQYPKSLPKKSLPLKTEPPKKREYTREEELKLQEVFLRRLKRARARGSALNDKVSSFKKSTNGSAALPEQTQKQVLQPDPTENVV